MHGLLATTWFSGPVIVVNGPITRAIGMNSGINALGPGNRANATIGRALQLVIRNVGGGRPGEIDRATLGQPGKYTFCFAEHEDAYWEPMHVERGYRAEQNTVTLFAGEGVRGIVDQLSRTPESLTAELRRVPAHDRAPEAPARVRRDARRSRPTTCGSTRRPAGPRRASARRSERCSCWMRTSSIRGVDGIEEGVPESLAGHEPAQVPRGWFPHRPCRRWRRTVLGHHRRVGEWEDGLGPSDHRGEAHDHAARSHERTRSGTRELARRPVSLDGLTIGLLDIAKARGDVFLDRIADAARRRAATRSCDSPSRRSPSRRRSTCATRSPPPATS